MPRYYNNPASYYESEQSRREQKLQNALQLMMQLKAFQERQRQAQTQEEQWGQQQELDWNKLALQQREHESLADWRKYQQQPKPPAPSDAMKTIEYLVETGVAPDRKTAWQYYKGIKSLKQIEEEANAKAKGAGTGYYKPKSTDIKKEEDKIRNYWNRKRVEVKLKTSSMDTSALAKFPTLMGGQEDAIKDVMAAIDEAEKRELDRLYTGKSEEGKLEGTIVGNQVIVNGKPYDMDENGQITINGKKYKIE